MFLLIVAECLVVYFEGELVVIQVEVDGSFAILLPDVLGIEKEDFGLFVFISMGVVHIPSKYYIHCSYMRI